MMINPLPLVVATARRHPVVWLVVVAGVILSWLTFQVLETNRLKNRFEEFQLSAQLQFQSIENNIGLVVHFIWEIDDFFTRPEPFSQKNLETWLPKQFEEHAGLQYVLWLPRISRHERTDHELSAATHIPHYKIAEETDQDKFVPAAPRDTYFPILHVGPVTGRQTLHGYDMASRPDFRAAIDNAIASGNPTGILSGMPRLNEGRKPVFLFFIPAYRHDKQMDATPKNRDNFLGISVAVFRIDTLVALTMHDSSVKGIDFQLRDTTDINLHPLLSHHGTWPYHAEKSGALHDRQVELTWNFHKKLPVADRTWLFTAYPNPDFIKKGVFQIYPRLFLGSGLLITLLISLYVFQTQRSILERQQTLHSLNEAKDYTDSIIASMGDPLLVVSGTGIIQRVNRAACDLLHCAENDLVNQSIEPLFFANQEESVFARIRQIAMRHPGLHNFETALRTRDAQKITVLLSGTVLPDRNEEASAIVCVAKDITHRMLIEQQRDHLLRILQVNNQILQAALDTLPLPRILEQALSHIVSASWFGNQKKGCVFLIGDRAGEEEETEQLQLMAQVGFSEKLSVNDCDFQPADLCLCKRAVQSKIMLFSDHPENTPSHEAPHAHYCIPILADEQVLGVLNLYVDADHLRTHDDEDFLHAIANTLSGIITRHRMAENLRQNTLQMAETNARLVERETFLRTVLAAARDAIIIMDHNQRVIEFNPAAEQMFGYTQNKMLGQDLTDFIIPPEYRERHRAGVERYNRTGRAAMNGWVELPGLCADGSVISLHVAITPIRIRNKTLFTAVLHDITERKQAMAIMEDSLKIAESASRAKSDFIANMSHEIRTPMNAIIGLTSLALRTDPPPKLYQYLSRIETASHTLLSIINDILDFSRIEAGRMQLEQVPFDLHDLFDHLAELFNQLATAKELELILATPPDACPVILGDPLRLKQILINLIRNAIKFTERGSITVAVQSRQNMPVADMAARQTPLNVPTPPEWTFTITDTGIGIDPEILPHLFEPFVQADGSTTRKYGGTGLGLSISKRLVDMMAGRIWATSEPGKGSVFSFCIPMACQSASPPKPIQLPESVRRLHILIVDDHPLARTAILNHVTACGFTADAVASGAAALTILKSTPAEVPTFDLIILDWIMPEMDGMATLQNIQTLFKTQTASIHTPKSILLSVCSQEKAAAHARSLNLHINALLEKPVSRFRLLDAILTIFGEQPLQKQHMSQILVTEAEFRQQIGTIRILLVEDNDFNRQVAQELLERVGILVDHARHGAEAIDKIQNTPYDGVLMDIQMPVMDGFSATRHLRADARFGTLPIIAMTAHTMPEEQQKCLDAGMNAHIAKPIHPGQLYSVIAQWIRPATPATLPPNTSFPATLPMVVPDISQDESSAELPDVPGVDLSAGLERMGHNLPVYLRLLIRFRDDYANTGSRLQSALEQGDSAAVRQLAHTLKGVAGNIGANDLHQAATDLEAAFKQNDIQKQIRAREHFDQTMATLLQALAVVQPVSEPLTKAPPETSRATVDPTRILTLLTELATLLLRNSFETSTVRNSLRQYLQETPASPLFLELEKHLSRYDFEGAMQKLDQIALILNVSLQKE
ncbi:MAG: response regulator [Magnetococcus sp. DMHC-1]